MDAATQLPETPADAAATPRPRADRPPIGRFLLLFGGLLAAALSLAALSPERQRDDAVAITEPASAWATDAGSLQKGRPQPLPPHNHDWRNRA